MAIYGIVINDSGEVVSHRLAPHQADDCDGLIYKATDKDGTDLFLFLIEARDEGTAIFYARDTFEAGGFAVLDPMWQPGSIWPETPDEGRKDSAQVLIIDSQHKPYITTVPTHGRVNPFIDHFGERITWAYMRLVEQKCCEELERTNERWRRYWKEHPTPQPQQEQQEPAGEPAGTVAEPCGKTARHSEQLFLDFG